MNIDIFELLPTLVIGFVLLIVLLIILKRIMVNVGAREIAIKERRYLGSKMPPGRVVATEGEVGIQADVLKPGLHLIRFPFEKVVRKVPLIEIGADELGIVEAMMVNRWRREEFSRLTALRMRTTIFRIRLPLLNKAA